MRALVSKLIVAACVLPALSHAQSANPYIQIVGKAGTVAAGGTTTVKAQCPPGSYPVGYSLKSKHAGKVEEIGTSVLDKNGNIVDLSSVTDASVLNGGGQGMAVTNKNLSVAEDFDLIVVCFSPTAFTDGVATIVKATTQVPPGTSGNVYAHCPAGNEALGAVSDSGQPGLVNQGTSPIFGTSANPVFLGNVGDGTTGPPTGWEATAYNAGNIIKAIAVQVICGKAPAAQTKVYSATVNQGAGWMAESGSVPSNRRVVGWGYDAYYNYVYNYYFRYYWDLWGDDGNLASARLYAKSHADWFFVGRVRGISGRAVVDTPKSLPMPKATVRIVYGLVTVPETAAPPPTTTVTVVEFYNQALDHYFITANAQEISDLDSGVHVGWARTGQSFKAYGIGSGGPEGRQPVCRAYGNPTRGLDSHFYSASMEECYATLSSFNDAWLFEASEVFEIDLPNTTTGACPPGGVPIYRVWNNRADSNHRYTTSIATRDQMVAKGYIAEGYGPDNVTLCALP